jgi:hypothetical protein
MKFIGPDIPNPLPPEQPRRTPTAIAIAFAGASSTRTSARAASANTARSKSRSAAALDNTAYVKRIVVAEVGEATGSKEGGMRSHDG